MINSYLSKLQEQYDASIAITDIKGDYDSEWTDCYETRCNADKGEYTKFAKAICKAECKIVTANNSIVRLNGIKSNCAKATNPQSCINQINRAIESFGKKLDSARDARTKALNRLAEFRRKSTAR